MKIGIMTFHWATNYGAVLQSYALQEALINMGHQVEIIDYKPKQFDHSFWNFVRYRKFLTLPTYLSDGKKERKLEAFRNQYLHRSRRYYSLADLKNIETTYDALITGSDQILNTFFLKFGEKGGSTAYFLDFAAPNIPRYSYAASFGTTVYPEELCNQVTPFISRFEAVSSREASGINIFKKMGAKSPVLVPDPTLLHSSDFYLNLIQQNNTSTHTVRSYFLRGREKFISSELEKLHVETIHDESLSQWIQSVKCSSHFITNSYHGVIFCLLFHTPFTVVLEQRDNIGMNDRFYTLLEPLGLTERIITESEFNAESPNYTFAWSQIDVKLRSFRQKGIHFLNNINTK